MRAIDMQTDKESGETLLSCSLALTSVSVPVPVLCLCFQCCCPLPCTFCSSPLCHQLSSA